MRFGQLTGASVHLYAVGSNALIACAGAYTISGGATTHWATEEGGRISCSGQTITTAETPAFTTFASASRSGIVSVYGDTFSGTGATGIRYNASTLGNIFVNGASTTYLPGNSAGVTGSGGQYN